MSSQEPSLDIDARIRDLPFTAELADAGLVLEADVDGSEEELWEAITVPEVLRRWSPIVPDRALTAVGPVLSRERPEDEPVAADVLAIAPGHALSHRWGDDEIDWDVEPGRLIVLMRLARPQDAAMYAAGWQVCFGVLDAILSGEDTARIVGQDAMDHGWEELHAQWAERLGTTDAA